ncbi:hypothetical protein HER10_EVM0001776 [Colletotrichum scovillei]|uniref:Ubiquitin carboxyl-terminal hydrolase family protein n=1 Tax=Colletotrichum scovillei TaxID=1209932 RepID=A0A9P7R1M2_9PEZI|nr:uncharacterized protein HER10_EVM0001776 [Colletotrichum scovillei]KAF4775902.1 hypothetical protein HER10_EVM0001776 [Colletotrichum scovillei]KAG7047841.1 ubiquitin carboxyl-terminal hydrolase family protein [Colletotrichum scovillei]KAG7060187.1 ubiquitin carboxyl-terminal hydrolase family protein [Colletotrichum scovillei]KAG7067608.1 ubiquitin carboxyl-terminal hydrolase family protein [Colletotrichum scovillei]
MSSFSPASTQPDTLPTPRVVITNLINSLTSAPLPPPSANTAGTSNNNAADAANPLKTLPKSHRPLLVTLHVLFPSLVLPALDLLDRNLVTRVVPETTTPPSAGLGHGHGHRERNNPTNPAPAALQHQPSTNPNDTASEAVADGQGSSPPPPRLQPATTQPPAAAAAAFHLVRSVASTMTRRHHAVATSASASTTYLVHLDAWNCSCANFAYEAFPAVVSGGGRDVDPDLVIMGADEAEDNVDGDNSEASDWQFGGLSLDGMDDGGVPCCKHLLACLLSEQWADTLGKYVTERRVSREEMAGLVADV